MSHTTRNTRISLRIGFVLWTIVMALVGTVTVALAAMVNISTPDNSLADWNGVAVFQTDPAGDVITATEDIINVWVASSLSGTQTITNLNFLMQTRGAPALSQSYRQAVAFIDCDRDGVDNEDHDRIVSYGLQNDRVIISQGNQGQMFYEGDCASNCPYGERVSSTAYIEWRVGAADLPPDPPGGPNPDSNCRNIVNIRFATISVNPINGRTTTIDQTSPLKVWDINQGAPTVVRLQDFRATSRERERAVPAAFLSMVAVLGASVWAYRRRLSS